MRRLAKMIAEEDAYINRHCISQILEELAYAMLLRKPNDHEHFALMWLISLQRKMYAAGATTAEGIDLRSILTDDEQLPSLDTRRKVESNEQCSDVEKGDEDLQFVEAARQLLQARLQQVRILS